MTLFDALEKRIPRVRMPQWADPTAYLRLPLLDGGTGPWAALYDPWGQMACGLRIGGQSFPMFGGHLAVDGWEKYDGPVSPWEDHPESAAHTYKES